MKTYDELQEGLQDPNIFKAFFLAGGRAAVNHTLSGTPLAVQDCVW